MIEFKMDKVWLVYEGGNLLCVVDSQSKAECICFVHDHRKWVLFIAVAESPE
jgi:hypothetical protein